MSFALLLTLIKASLALASILDECASWFPPKLSQASEPADLSSMASESELVDSIIKFAWSLDRDVNHRLIMNTLN
jgi:hypothetical protein